MMNNILDNKNIKIINRFLLYTVDVFFFFFNRHYHFYFLYVTIYIFHYSDQ